MGQENRHVSSKCLWLLVSLQLQSKDWLDFQPFEGSTGAGSASKLPPVAVSRFWFLVTVEQRGSVL